MRFWSKWGLCILLFFATTLNYLDRQVLSVLAPTVQAEMHFGARMIGTGGIACSKITNRLLLAVLVDLEVVIREIGNERAFLVGDRHPDVHQLDARTKDRYLLGGRSGPGDRQRGGENDPGVLHKPALYTRLLKSGTHGCGRGSGRSA